jgi:hypothetical protein
MSKTQKSLINFLFNEAQLDEDRETFLDEVAEIFEGMDELEAHKPDTTALKAALKEIGVDVDDEGLELLDDAMSLRTDCRDSYVRVKDLVLAPETQDKLAEKGWVAYAIDDLSSTTQEPEFVIKFLNLNLPDPSSEKDEFSDEDLEKLIGAARQANGFGGEDHVKDPV